MIHICNLSIYCLLLKQYIKQLQFKIKYYFQYFFKKNVVYKYYIRASSCIGVFQYYLHIYIVVYIATTVQPLPPHTYSNIHIILLLVQYHSTSIYQLQPVLALYILLDYQKQQYVVCSMYTLQYVSRNSFHPWHKSNHL